MIIYLLMRHARNVICDYANKQFLVHFTAHKIGCVRAGFNGNFKSNGSIVDLQSFIIVIASF